MSYGSIDELRSQLGASTKPSAAHSPEYVAKMLHPIPRVESVDRAAFILARVTGRRVLEFGATGPMHDAVVKAAASVVGVDREAGDGVYAFDLDDVREELVLPIAGEFPEVDIVLCGEVIEHLGNPQWFLTRLKRQYAGVPVLITVPHAHSSTATKHAAAWTNNVNRDHVAWYCHRTLQTLLERAGYRIAEFYFYGGPPPLAQGLIVIAE